MSKEKNEVEEGIVFGKEAFLGWYSNLGKAKEISPEEEKEYINNVKNINDLVFYWARNYHVDYYEADFFDITDEEFQALKNGLLETIKGFKDYISTIGIVKMVNRNKEKNETEQWFEFVVIGDDYEKIYKYKQGRFVQVHQSKV